MTDGDPAIPSVIGDGDGSEPDAAFRIAVAVYSGVLLGGLATILGSLTELTRPALAGTYGVGFVVGALGGAVLARIDPRLPTRLARTAAHRFLLVVPAVVFFGHWLVSPGSAVSGVVLASATLVFVTGFALAQLAGNRHVDAITAGDPVETWRWEPPGSLVLDLFLAGGWALLTVVNTVGGNWLEALFWLAMAAIWIASCLAEGRWSFAPGRNRCEIRCYDVGLVKRRPYTKTFVAWADVDHARLRDGELVLDRGFRDVRFDADDLEDHEAVFEAVERRLTATRR